MEKELEEALKPFNEKADLVDGFISEIRDKLGEEEATKINETLLGLQGTVKEAVEVHTTATEDFLKTSKRNKELLEVNNDLYIGYSQAIKGISDKNKKPELDTDMDDDEALDSYANAAMKGK